MEKDKVVVYRGAEIMPGCHCRACGCNVIDLNCRSMNIKPYDEWDWWAYCANPACENHKGEGQDQDIINWIENDTSIE